MQINNGSNKVVTSFLWKLFERGGVNVLQLIIQLFLARKLGPTIFGQLAILLVFVNVSNVFVQSGFNTALIQKKNSDELDFSTVLLFSLFVALLFYILIFFSSPIIADVYGIGNLKESLRVIGLILFPMAFSSVQNAYVSKKLLFNKVFIGSIISTFIGGIIAIILSFNGFGIWALVTQQLVQSILNPLILFILIDYKVKFNFSLLRLKSMFRFGSSILLANLVYELYLDLRSLIIGKFFLTSELGYFQRGEQIPRVAVTNIDSALQSVMLPTLSLNQDNKIKMKEITKYAIKYNSFIIFPMCIGLYVIAEPLVLLLLTDKWINSVVYLKIFSIMYSLWPILNVNLQPIRALGHSKIILRLEVLKRVIGLIIILISISFGPLYMALGALLERIIEMFINSYPNKYLINYSVFEQFSDIKFSIINSLIMGILVYFFRDLTGNIFINIVLQCSIGFILYLSLSLFNNKAILKGFFRFVHK